MLGELTQDQIDRLLSSQTFGRIGISDQNRVYIIPINYIFDGTYVYAHSLPGNKLQLMRSHPEVCLQVDKIKDGSTWQSALAWGTFQELSGDEAAKVCHQLGRQFTSLIASGYALHEMRASDNHGMPRAIIIYRIKLSEKTGRFEQPEEAEV
ncbi:pyridoxamine 5'-phosphate oxidase family protein [Dictyobacter aurantiacus]|uniref:Pyridoxamine 5'-phosphate oxidase n=1 Tax=Dictyobacter aurantiacus TaxID=1936993 RepID=A0A401ZNE9_9CHLR|nr:pyridoxamine 5'-phosphate oxidase family protein [Dictyobacter aurantiacus]GCE08286.1 hypothetical protein KDAU_56150 [Dictyobacter aurantiacus]